MLLPIDINKLVLIYAIEPIYKLIDLINPMHLHYGVALYRSLWSARAIRNVLRVYKSEILPKIQSVNSGNCSFERFGIESFFNQIRYNPHPKAIELMGAHPEYSGYNISKSINKNKNKKARKERALKTSDDVELIKAMLNEPDPKTKYKMSRAKISSCVSANESIGIINYLRTNLKFVDWDIMCKNKKAYELIADNPNLDMIPQDGLIQIQDPRIIKLLDTSKLVDKYMFMSNPIFSNYILDAFSVPQIDKITSLIIGEIILRFSEPMHFKDLVNITTKELIGFLKTNHAKTYLFQYGILKDPGPSFYKTLNLLWVPTHNEYVYEDAYGMRLINAVDRLV